MNIYALLEDWMRDGLYDCGIEDGTPWAVVKGPEYVSGYNGYAWCPDGHPWARSRGGDCYIRNEDVPWGELTYLGDNWVGFDTGHSGQWWPGSSRTRFRGDEIMTVEMVLEWAKLTARNVAKAAETAELRALEFTPTESDRMYLDLLRTHKEAEIESRTWNGYEVTRIMADKLVEAGWTRP